MSDNSLRGDMRNQLNNRHSRRRYEQARNSIILLEIMLFRLEVLNMKMHLYPTRGAYDKFTTKMNDRWNLFG